MIALNNEITTGEKQPANMLWIITSTLKLCLLKKTAACLQALVSRSLWCYRWETRVCDISRGMWASEAEGITDQLTHGPPEEQDSLTGFTITSTTCVSKRKKKTNQWVLLFQVKLWNVGCWNQHQTALCKTDEPRHEASSQPGTCAPTSQSWVTHHS